MDEQRHAGDLKLPLLFEESIVAYIELNDYNNFPTIFHLQVLAHDKADAIVKEVGYPEWLPDDDALDKYFKNVIILFLIL